MIEENEPTQPLLQLKLCSIFVFEIAEHCGILLSSYFYVLLVLLKREKHLGSDMIEETPFSFENFDNFRDILERKESLRVFLHLLFDFLE